MGKPENSGRSTKRSKSSVPPDLDKRLLSGIRAALRQLWMFYSPVRRKALLDSRVDYDKAFAMLKMPSLIKKRSLIYHYCKACNGSFRPKGVRVDHVNPVGTLTMDNLGEWAKNLFYGEQQVLCQDCHQKKTNEDRRKGRTHV